MTKLIGMFVALMLSAAVSASENKGFYYGAKDPEHLARLIEASLKKDPTGGTMLDAVKCKKDGSCARPKDYLEMFQEVDPKADLVGVSGLPAFLRRLVVRPAPEGKYRVSCLKPSGDGFTAVLECLDRPFEPGEKAWVNPETGFVVLMEKCTNPTKGPAPLEITVTGHKCTVSGYDITANAWARSSFSSELKQKADALIAAANNRDGHEGTDLDTYKGDAISRTLGRQLRTEVKVQAPVTMDIRMRYVVIDRETKKVAINRATQRPMVRDVGTLRLVNGVGKFKFPDDPREHVVEAIWPESFVSPTISGDERRLRIFPNEWGEVCGVHMHGIVP